MITNNGVYLLETNRKGIEYLVEGYTGEVVAKRCSNCSEWKFLNGYNNAGKGFAGKHSLCRTCHKENGATYREDQKQNKELNEIVSYELVMMEKRFENQIKQSLRTGF